MDKNFEIACTNTKAFEDTSDGVLYVEGIANTGLEDLYGDVVTENALKEICEQIPKHNLHLDHDKGFDGVLGPLISGEVTPDGLKYKARIIDEKKDFIRSLLRQGVNIGSSISGKCSYEEDSLTNIAHWTLTELSLTLIPADQGTMATVNLSKTFDTILMELKAKLMEDKKMADDIEINEETVISLINQALNEERDALKEELRDEVKAEYEPVINELKERVETLESLVTDSDDEPTGDEGTDEEPVPPTNLDGEPAEDEEDEEDEEEAKNLAKMIRNEVRKSLNDAFNGASKSNYRYSNKHASDLNADNSRKNSYTPREIAEMM